MAGHVSLVNATVKITFMATTVKCFAIQTSPAMTTGFVTNLAAASVILALMARHAAWKFREMEWSLLNIAMRSYLIAL
jgi:thymidylate synthase